MSKLARKPIPITTNVTITKEAETLSVKGVKGTLIVPVLKFVNVEMKNNEIMFSTGSEGKQARSNLGTMVSLVKNAMVGVSEGYTQKLEIEGVGYRASMEGTMLVLSVGFSHPVKIAPIPGTTLAVEKNVITVSGIDKAIVSQAAATIRKIKKPEPYKGKGIRYAGEAVRRKAGKKVAGTTA